MAGGREGWKEGVREGGEGMEEGGDGWEGGKERGGKEGWEGGEREGGVRRRERGRGRKGGGGKAARRRERGKERREVVRRRERGKGRREGEKETRGEEHLFQELTGLHNIAKTNTSFIRREPCQQLIEDAIILLSGIWAHHTSLQKRKHTGTKIKACAVI